MATARVARGRQSEAAVAKLLQEHGWVNAERRPASLPGTDIMDGIAGTAIEIKARRDFNPVEFYKQAKKNAKRGELAIVIMRPDGAGTETVDSWPAFVSTRDLIELLKGAGYGDV